MKKNILNIVKTTVLAYLFIILLVIMLALGIIIYEWYDERKSKKL